MNQLIKRVFDIVMSLIGLILCLPLFIVLSILIKLESRGGIFFIQNRIGKNGRVFSIIKFRSMVVNAEQMEEGLFNVKDDPRVTRVGKFMRDTSLDELPQFINIFKGDMSFVGPRPPVTYELGNYTDWSEDLKRSFSIKPGVTGLAQVSGRNELNWEQKTQYNLAYLDKFKKFGFLYDLKIIFLTIIKVLKNEGSYELLENIETDKKKVKKGNE